MNYGKTYPYNFNSGGIALSTFSEESAGFDTGGSFASTGVGAWPTANKAIFVPVKISRPLIINKFVTLNGATLSGNVDVGMYDEQGTKLVSSGSTAQAGVSIIQTFDVTNTMIGPGRYYLAIALDNATGQVLTANPNLAFLIMIGLAEKTTAFPLPATVAMATLAASKLPFIGVIEA